MDKLKDLASLFRVYDQALEKEVPMIFADGQLEIFETIVRRKYPRTHCISCTQYGKSFTVASAVLMRVITHPEKWAIIAPSESKAMIIMRYILDFCDRQPLFKAALEDSDSKKKLLKKEKSKKRLVFGNGGEIFVLSADNKNKSGEGEALMGYGCITAGHKIRTDKGDFPIEEVVKKRMDVKILTFNHDTGEKEYKDILEYQDNPRGDRDIYEIKVGDKKFECTEDHPVFVVGKGYIPARDVSEGDEVYVD